MGLLRRFIISIAIFALLAGSLGTYALVKYRQRQRTARQTAKAPEVTITILEGWGVGDIAEYLDQKGLVSAPEFLTYQRNFDASNYRLLESKPAKFDLEGFLYPDTYQIFKPSANANQDAKILSESIIKKQLDNFTAKFTPAMEQQAKARNMSVFEIITLASIIEKEGGRNAVSAQAKQQTDEERRTIAGIFYNRLAAGMPLQSDATVNYITKKNTPAASAGDLTIDSPYNTYKYQGLPPGPICNPSLSSIMAALEPIETPYYYFLHKQPSGEAVFSKTFEEHVANKIKYLK